MIDGLSEPYEIKQWDVFCENNDLLLENDQLKAENEKLRELLWELFHCSRQVGCDCCEIIYRRNCGVLDRIRELGIEVD